MPQTQSLFTLVDPVTSAAGSGGEHHCHHAPPKGGAGGGGAPTASTVHSETRAQRLARILSGDVGRYCLPAAKFFDDREADRLEHLHRLQEMEACR